ncbi:hypothetical protein QA640_30905 [Bradyrhizobium sp. CB82]|uniref:hypothetical protein n=1 Tax=Bradyrhizobium sp. CB82 TaxID=3039159 RepID=UPI0024B13E3C|nr:hypothetical protein [Bradyrhizobium sp. CB82]WFU38792.1 hypothetical protein QA640_30905 [Bradyrhizobium sp. CB82]
MTQLQRVDGEIATFKPAPDVMLVDPSVYPLALDRQFILGWLQKRRLSQSVRSDVAMFDVRLEPGLKIVGQLPRSVAWVRSAPQASEDAF